MAILADDDFQSYALGLNPPFTSYQNYNTAGVTEVVNTLTGIYGDAKSLAMRVAGVQYPILPTITLAQALAGDTYTSRGVPSYSETSVFWGLLIAAGGTDEQGSILLINYNVNPFAGNTLLTVEVLNDGTLSFVSPNARWAVSDFSLLSGTLYFLQLNVAFTTDGGFIRVTASLAVDGLVVISGSFKTAIGTGGFPSLYWNNIVFAGAGGGGGYIWRSTIYDTQQAIGSVPHPGSPEARISEGVIELVLSPEEWRVYEA